MVACSRTRWVGVVPRVPSPPLSASLPGLVSASSHCGSSLVGAWKSQGLVEVPRVGAEKTERCDLGRRALAPAVAHGTLSVGRPSGPGILGTEGRGDSRSRGVAVHGRRQLGPSSRGTWGRSPAGDGNKQKGGAWEEERGLSLQASASTPLYELIPSSANNPVRQPSQDPISQKRGPGNSWSND